MDSSSDTGPSSEGPSRRARRAADAAPLFPLPNVFLFPGCVMPLHIFEPRYRQMIEDLLDGPGRLVLGTVLEQHAGDLAASPPVHPIAGLGEIGRHERLPDGRFLIWLIGLRRVSIRELPSERPYRRVSFALLREIDVDGERARPLRSRLEKAILARCDERLSLPADMPIGSMADLLLQRMQLPQRRMQELYSELVVADRAEEALAEHLRRPPPPKTDPRPDC